MPDGEFSLSLRVYIEDTDAGGIVYYVNYLKFMERARTEFMRSLGYGKRFIFNEELMFVVKNVGLEYFQPAQLDDEIEATVRISALAGASMTLAQSVRRGGDILAAGDIRIACVDRAELRPRRIPQEMLAALRSVA